MTICTQSICFWYAPNFPLCVCVCTHIHIHPQIVREDVEDIDSNSRKLKERVKGMSYPPRVLLHGEDLSGWINLIYLPQCPIPTQTLSWGPECEFLYICTCTYKLSWTHTYICTYVAVRVSLPAHSVHCCWDCCTAHRF